VGAVPARASGSRRDGSRPAKLERRRVVTSDVRVPITSRNEHHRPDRFAAAAERNRSRDRCRFRCRAVQAVPARDAGRAHSRDARAVGGATRESTGNPRTWLHVFDIYVPALRERLADIPLLTEHVLAEFAKAMGRRPARLADDARDVRLAHDWPGNIRELRNVLEAATILSDDGIIERQHLSWPVKGTGPASPYDLGAIERHTIEAALNQTDGNTSKTARILGLTRSQSRACVAENKTKGSRSRSVTSRRAPASGTRSSTACSRTLR
jgi:hypothetical protein